jgi:hypothetical protein
MPLGNAPFTAQGLLTDSAPASTTPKRRNREAEFIPIPPDRT